jgi:hypothetical protein
MIDLITAHQHVPLRHNPIVILFLGMDAVLVLYLTAALAVLQRQPVTGASLALVITTSMLAASCIKLTILGEPGFFADALLLPDLLRVLEPWLALCLMVATSAVAVAFLANFRLPRTRRERLLVAPLVVLALYFAGLQAEPSLAHFAASKIPVPGRAYPAYGHFYGAYAVFVRNADWKHTMARLQAVRRDLGVPPALGRAQLPDFVPRNLHIVVAESFTDPAWYTGYGLLDAELPPLFKRWRMGPTSTALSPVFAGRSSNAEFEVLCGVPAAVGPSEMVFWRVGERSLPCLPGLLAQHGYVSRSLVPSSPDIFNAAIAYRSFGFSRSVFSDELDMTDRDGNYLSAEATLARHLERLAPLLEAAAPVFSYVFINANHYPYTRNEGRRPTVLRPTPDDPTIEAYVNGAYYSALAIDRFVEQLRTRDPTGLIVILGDHAPALGRDFAGYRFGGRVASDEPDPLRRASLYEVPLLVLDAGEHVAVGRLPTYLIPYLVLDRLTGGRFCQANSCEFQSPWRLRPFRDFALVVEANGGGERLCPDLEATTEPCQAPAAETLAWQLELLDLIDQHGSLRDQVM